MAVSWEAGVAMMLRPEANKHPPVLVYFLLPDGLLFPARVATVKVIVLAVFVNNKHCIINGIFFRK